MGEELSTGQLIARAREAYARGEYAPALADLREALGRQPAFADVHHLLGLCLSLLGRPEEAVVAFDEAVQINPRYAEALLSRAITLQEIGRYDEARESFEAASEVDMEEGVGRFPGVLAGRLATGHVQLGDLYAEGGALPEAVEEYRKASLLRPRYVDMRNKLARALLDLGETEAAIEELRQALDINPDFFAARINLGLAWYRMGDLAAARREWERCRELQPDSAQVAVFLGLLERTERAAQVEALQADEAAGG